MVYEIDIHPNIILDKIQAALDYTRKQRTNRRRARFITIITTVGLEIILGYSTNKNLNNLVEKASPEIKRRYEIDKELSQLCYGMNPLNAIAEYKKNTEFNAQYNKKTKECESIMTKNGIATEYKSISEAQKQEITKITTYTAVLTAAFLATQIAITKKLLF